MSSCVWRLIAAIALSTCCSSATASEILFLDALPGANAVGFVEDVSPDGASAVGIAPNGPVGIPRSQEAVRWTSVDGMTTLGLIDGNLDNTSYAVAVSSQGQVVVGSAHGSVNGTYGNHAFRWNSTAGMEILTFPAAWQVSNSGANGVSDDGNRIVGGFDNGYQARSAFLWSDNSTELIGDLPGGREFGSAYAISGDGSTVVGIGESHNGMEAFLWTKQLGIVALGDLPGGDFHSSASAVSENGSVVVGFGRSASSNTKSEAFRWTADGGMVGLGDLPGGEFMSVADDVSAEGSIVVGYSAGESGQEAFIWDASNGMRSLREVLVAEHGLDAELDGWRLTSAKGISADGKIIVGEGVGPNGVGSWMVRLDGVPVPEPRTTALAATAIAILALRLRRKRIVTSLAQSAN